MNAQVKILYFGTAREISGKAEESLNCGDTASLREEIFRKYPAMRYLSFRIALNSALIWEESGLKENDVIAILPPFQGG